MKKMVYEEIREKRVDDIKNEKDDLENELKIEIHKSFMFHSLLTANQTKAAFLTQYSLDSNYIL